MYNATLIEGDTWAVSETDVDGHVTARHKVAVRAGGTGDDAIAAVEEMKQPPSAEEIAGRQQESRVADIKAACRRRIFAVAKDELTQANMVEAAALGEMRVDHLAKYRVIHIWKSAMRVACQEIILDPARDHRQDSEWPTVPPGVAELAALF